MKKNTIIAAILASVLFLALTINAYAETGEQVFHAFSDSRIDLLFRNMGVKYEKMEDGQFMFVQNDHKMLLFNNSKNMVLLAGFDIVIPLPAVNLWNRRMRFSRAYLNNRSEPFLQADLDLEGGISRNRIENFIVSFIRSVDMFAGMLAVGDNHAEKHINSNDNSKKVEI